MMPCPEMKKEPNLIITPAEFPVPLILLPETESTNNYLTQLCDEQPSAVQELTTVIAERNARSLFRREGYHRYADANGEFLARLLRVEPDGRFILEDRTGKERGYLFKEVQYIL